MSDQHLEPPAHPLPPWETAAFRSVLVLAPSLRQAVCGCGGLIALLREHSAVVKMVIALRSRAAADGAADAVSGSETGESETGVEESAEAVQIQEAEAAGEAEATDETPDARGGEAVTADEAAAGTEQDQDPASSTPREVEAIADLLLSINVDFLDVEPGFLRLDDGIVAALRQRFEEVQPDLVLAPSIAEPDAGSQSLALAAIEALREGRVAEATLAFFECEGTLMPNAGVDISGVADRKVDAMNRLGPGPGCAAGAEQSISLNRFRAYALGTAQVAAEAYHVLRGPNVWQHYASFLQPGVSLRRGHDLPVDPAEVPLVSVILRSVGRPTLEDAITSVAVQTYPRIEIVVVDATGGCHRPLPEKVQGRTLRLVQSTTPLARPAAANLGLEHALGEEIVFLDDDDLFYPRHVQRLVDARVQAPQNLAAYSDVEVVDRDGKRLLDYDSPWVRERLLLTNFLPVHAVLFSRQLLKKGCRFDESLEILEDWDFWIQVVQKTELTHVPGVSAVYRYGRGFSEHAKHYRRWRQAVVMKWVDRLGVKPYEEAFYWAARQLDESSQLADFRERKWAECEQSLGHERALLAQARVQLQDLQAEKEALHHHLQVVRKEYEGLQAQYGAALEQIARVRLDPQSLEEGADAGSANS